MSPAPSKKVTIGSGAGSQSPAADSGTAFFVGLTNRGSVNEAVAVRSMSDAVTKLGPRTTFGLIYDALDAFFKLGGSLAHIGRLVGPAPVLATGNLLATATPTLTVKAVSPGEWGNDLDAKVVAAVTNGSFHIEVIEGTTTVERSPALLNNTEAVAWAATSSYIRLTDLGQGDPDVQTISLASGADDRANITSTQVTAALNLFTADLGPGQVAYPGATDGPSHALVAAHAVANNRTALLDATNTAVEATVTAQAIAVRATGNGRSAGIFWPWAQIPGVTPGTIRTVPYSAVQAGLAARSDGATGNPNLAIAGKNAIAEYLVGLSQPALTQAGLDAMSEAGVNVARVIDGQVRTYDNKTCANPSIEADWLQLSNSRLAMFIASRANEIAEDYMFAQLDGGSIKVAEFGGDLKGMLLPLFDPIRALFGESFDDAAVIDVGEGVNPPADIAAGILRASISVRMSPAAERVEINIKKVAAKETI